MFSKHFPSTYAAYAAKFSSVERRDLMPRYVGEFLKESESFQRGYLSSHDPYDVLSNIWIHRSHEELMEFTLQHIHCLFTEKFKKDLNPEVSSARQDGKLSLIMILSPTNAMYECAKYIK